MRIAVVHNAYSGAVPSGENASVAAHRRVLVEAGLSVTVHGRSNDAVRGRSDAARAMAAGVASRGLLRRLVDEILATDPDIVHVENLVPLLPHRLPHVLSAEGVPVVQRWRSYRFACIAGTLYREGAMCLACTEPRRRWPGVRHACFADSRLASAAVAIRSRSPIGGVLYAPTSTFVAERLIQAGAAPQQVVQIPNFVEDFGAGFSASNREGVLFLGRLVPEKGIAELVEAWHTSKLLRSHRLTIAGSGPLEAELRAVSRRGSDVRFLGNVSPAEAHAALLEAAFVVVPSMWDEPFGRTAVEALCAGAPVIATAVGGLKEIIDGEVGWTANPTVDALREALETAVATTGDHYRKLALDARERYETHYSSASYVSRFLSMYGSLRDGRNRQNERDQFRA